MLLQILSALHIIFCFPHRVQSRGSFCSCKDLFCDWNIISLPSHVNYCFQWSKSVTYQCNISYLLCCYNLFENIRTNFWQWHSLIFAAVLIMTGAKEKVKEHCFGGTKIHVWNFNTGYHCSFPDSQCCFLLRHLSYSVRDAGYMWGYSWVLITAQLFLVIGRLSLLEKQQCWSLKTVYV